MPEKNNLFYLTDNFDFDFPCVAQSELYFYQRNLPHFERDGAFYFVTFRLANSIPISVIRRIREEFNRIWKYIDYNALKAGLADEGGKWRWGSEYWFEQLHEF